jgi:putative transposase
MSARRSEWPKTTSLLDLSRGLPLSGRRAAGVTRGETSCVNLLLHDRDTKFCAPFRTTLAAEGIKAVALPGAQPQFERMRKTMGARQKRMSVTDPVRRRFFTTRLSEFVDHFHTARNHQENVFLFPSDSATRRLHNRAVFCRERLGRLLKYYCSAA